MTADSIPDVKPEAYWLEEYPHLFGQKELRCARKAGKIGYFRCGRGFGYTPEQIADYLRREKQVQPCETSPPEPAIE